MGWNLRFDPQIFLPEPLVCVAVLKALIFLCVTMLTASATLRVAPADAVPLLHVTSGRAALVPASRARPCVSWPLKWDNLLGRRTGLVHCTCYRTTLVPRCTMHRTERPAFRTYVRAARPTPRALHHAGVPACRSA
ncbi:hypothetical protein HAX54_040847, partial [Datura stramonium]|nr:hypothetical protein [Datura stramonium]